MIRAWLGAAPALTCGGVAAAERVAFAERMGFALFLLAAAMAALGVWKVWSAQLGRRVLAPLLIVVVAHPGLWMDGSSGDCGQEMQVASIIFTILALSLLAWIFARPRLNEAADQRE